MEINTYSQKLNELAESDPQNSTLFREIAVEIEQLYKQITQLSAKNNKLRSEIALYALDKMFHKF